MPGGCVPSGAVFGGGEAVGIGAGGPPRNIGVGTGECGKDGSNTSGGSAILCGGIPTGGRPRLICADVIVVGPTRDAGPLLGGGDVSLCSPAALGEGRARSRARQLVPRATPPPVLTIITMMRFRRMARSVGGISLRKAASVVPRGRSGGVRTPHRDGRSEPLKAGAFEARD